VSSTVESYAASLVVGLDVTMLKAYAEVRRGVQHGLFFLVA
jgi:hypothetical protein